jgi:hypothetical protein
MCTVEAYVTEVSARNINSGAIIGTEKLTGPHLVEKFPTFYETPKFITAFTRTRHPFIFQSGSEVSVYDSQHV